MLEESLVSALQSRMVSALWVVHGAKSLLAGVFEFDASLLESLQEFLGGGRVEPLGRRIVSAGRRHGSRPDRLPPP